MDGAPTARRGRADARAPGASPRTGGRAAVRRGRHGWRRAPTACRGRPLTSWARPSARSCAPGRPYGSADARWARAGAKRGRSARGEVGLGFRRTLRASMLAADFAPRLRLDTIGCRSERPTSDAAAVAGGVQRSTCHPVAWALSSEEDAAGDSAVAAHPFERDSVPRGDVLEGCRLHLLSKWRRYAVRQTDAAPLGRVKVEDERRRVASCPLLKGRRETPRTILSVSSGGAHARVDPGGLALTLAVRANAAEPASTRVSALTRGGWRQRE